MNQLTPAAGPDPTIATPGIPGFLQWVHKRQPYLYRRVEKKLPKGALNGLAGLGLTDPVVPIGVDVSLVTSPTVSSSDSNSIADALQSLLMGAGQVYLTKQQLDAQKQILNVQLDRAKNNLPPLGLDPTKYGLPGPTVNVGLAPETKQLLVIGGSVAAAGFLAWLIFGSGGSRRRARA